MGNNVKIKLGKRDVKDRNSKASSPKEKVDSNSKVVTTKSIKQEK